jgi:foldase protein PrsA
LKRYLFALVALAILVSSCSSSAEVAATVNGTDIETSEVQSLIFEQTDDLANDEFVQLLDLMVQWTAIADTAEEDFGIDPTTEEIDTEVQRIYAEQGAGLEFEQFLEQQNISEDGLDMYAAQLLIGADVLAELTESVEQPTAEEAQQVLIDDPYNWTNVCAAHILVATTEEATSVLDRLEGGDDFAAVAVELSLDTGSGANGGDLGCTVPSGYVESFADGAMTAEIGDVVGPIESQFGFHLIRVDSRTEATVEELQTGLHDTNLSQAIDDWYVGSLAAAEVTIAEEYGTWETEPLPGIVPVAS